MKKTKFYVIFEDHTIDVSSFSVKDAVIIACAKSIENAQNYNNIIEVLNLETNERTNIKSINVEL